MSMRTYATYAQARNEITKRTAAAMPDSVVQAPIDDYIWEKLQEVGERMAQMFTDWSFEPVLETRSYDAYGQHIDQWTNTLSLEAPLLATTAVVAADGTTLTQWDGQRSTRNDANIYEPVAVNNERTPYIALRRLNRSWGAPQNGVGQITVTGYWGYNRQGLLFKDSGDTVLNDPLAVDGREITVASIIGEDYFFNSPRFSRGNVLRLVTGDDTEFVRILDTNLDVTLKVERAINGTTAVAHAKDTVIEVWYPEQAIVRAVSKWVAYMVSSFGRFSNFTIDEIGVSTKFPTDIPPEVMNILKEYDLEMKLKQPRAI